jgi:hypothetical protein
MQDQLLRVKAEISYLRDEIRKLEKQSDAAYKQYSILKKDCTHKYLDGSSAIRCSWEYDTCDICGANF